jgi:putative FmdB family regulatory protein
MPIYEYRCERGHTFEVMQRMTDDPLTVCDEHGAPVQRVFHPVAVHFKGSGFYNTDYGKKKSGAAGASSEGSSSEGSSKSDSSKSDSSGSGSSGSGSSGSGSSGSGSSGSGSKDSSSTKSSSGSE